MLNLLIRAAMVEDLEFSVKLKNFKKPKKLFPFSLFVYIRVLCALELVSVFIINAVSFI